MNIILKPSVHVLSFPYVVPHPTYELPPDGSDTERLIATAGKICYDSYGVGGHPVTRHVRNLVSQLHFSVIEHANISLVLSGISRGCSHEIVRHRHFSFSQRSTRYTAEEGASLVLDPYVADLFVETGPWTNEAGTWMPRDREVDPARHKVRVVSSFIEEFESALLTYADLVKELETLNPEQLSGTALRKWARGKARQVLPHSLETRMVMTGNLRAWREFLVKRTSRHAEEEMRRLAHVIYMHLAPLAGEAFATLREEYVNGYYELTEITA